MARASVSTESGRLSRGLRFRRPLGQAASLEELQRKEGRPSCSPISKILMMLGWSSSRHRLGLETARSSAGAGAGLDHLEGDAGDSAFDGGPVHDPHAAASTIWIVVSPNPRVTPRLEPDDVSKSSPCRAPGRRCIPLRGRRVASSAAGRRVRSERIWAGSLPRRDRESAGRRAGGPEGHRDRSTGRVRSGSAAFGFEVSSARPAISDPPHDTRIWHGLAGWNTIRQGAQVIRPPSYKYMRPSLC